MRGTTHHRVDGIGKQHPPTTNTEFDPETYERAIHGLQQLILDIGRLEHTIDVTTETPEDYTPNHKHGEENGEKTITVEEDTMLYNAIRIIPEKWDVSVLNDTVVETGYAVRASVDCGGGVLVTATLFIQDGMLRKLNITHTSMSDRDEEVEIKDITNHEPSRVLAHMTRYLERTVTQAYAGTIGSAAKAFDYIGTKRDIEPTGKLTPHTRSRYEQVNQKEWADIREKTQQTVSDNVRAARDTLPDTDHDPFNETNLALLEEEPPDIALR